MKPFMKQALLCLSLLIGTNALAAEKIFLIYCSIENERATVSTPNGRYRTPHIEVGSADDRTGITYLKIFAFDQLEENQYLPRDPLYVYTARVEANADGSLDYTMNTQGPVDLFIGKLHLDPTGREKYSGTFVSYANKKIYFPECMASTKGFHRTIDSVD